MAKEFVDVLASASFCPGSCLKLADAREDNAVECDPERPRPGPSDLPCIVKFCFLAATGYLAQEVTHRCFPPNAALQLESNTSLAFKVVGISEARVYSLKH